MKRYFLIFFLIFSDTIYAQKSLFKKHNLTLNVVNKIDFAQKFNLTDNKVAELFKDALLKKNVNVSGIDNRYLVSISYGWKYKRSTELEIDNYTGFIVDIKNGDRVLAEFSSSKTKNLEESIDALVSKLFYENERIDNNGKFIDISDHFKKMDMSSWDSSRPDSHAPAGIFTDHTHNKDGVMIGYKLNLSSSKDNFNGNDVFTQDQITQFYDLHVLSQSSLNHLIELMYGLSDKLTISSILSIVDKKTTYINKRGDELNLNSTGIGDAEVQILYSIYSSKWFRIHSNLGLELPIGSITKEQENKILPYSMQIGNGYLSTVLGFTSLFQGSFFSGGFQPIARIPLHNNSRNYSYGKEFDISYWVSFKLNNMLSLSYRQNFVKSQKIKGSDSDLNIQEMVLNNSNNSGYRIFNNALGINLSINKGIMRNSRVSLEYKIPLYQSFDGLQIGNINEFNLSLQYTPGGHKGH